MRERKIQGTTWVCPTCFSPETEPCVGTLTGRKLSVPHHGPRERHRDTYIKAKRDALESLWGVPAEHVGLNQRQRKLADKGQPVKRDADGMRLGPLPPRPYVGTPQGVTPQELTMDVENGRCKFVNWDD